MCINGELISLFLSKLHVKRKTTFINARPKEWRVLQFRCSFVLHTIHKYVIHHFATSEHPSYRLTYPQINMFWCLTW